MDEPQWPRLASVTRALAQVQRTTADLAAAGEPTPCQIEPDLWDSTAVADRRDAQAGCRQCPILSLCTRAMLSLAPSRAKVLVSCTLAGAWVDASGSVGTQWAAPRRRNRHTTDEPQGLTA